MVRSKNDAGLSNPPKRSNVASASTFRGVQTKKKARRQLPVDEPTFTEVEEELQSEEEEQETGPPYDRTKFTSAANETWYIQRLKTKVLLEKDIAPDVENHYHIKAQFARFGWDG